VQMPLKPTTCWKSEAESTPQTKGSTSVLSAVPYVQTATKTQKVAMRSCMRNYNRMCEAENDIRKISCGHPFLIQTGEQSDQPEHAQPSAKMSAKVADLEPMLRTVSNFAELPQTNVPGGIERQSSAKVNWARRRAHKAQV